MVSEDGVAEDHSEVTKSVPIETSTNGAAGQLAEPRKTGRATNVCMAILHWGTLALAITCMALASFGFGLGRVDLCGLSVALGSLVFCGWTLYTLAISVLVFGRKIFLLARAALPMLLANTLTVWGLMMAMYAVVLSYVFDFVKSYENRMPRQTYSTFAAFAAGTAAYILPVLLVLLIGVCAFAFRAFYKSLAECGRERFGMKIEAGGAQFMGVMVGTIIGLNGLWSCLNSPAQAANNIIQFMALANLGWCLAVLVSISFLNVFRHALAGKVLDKKAGRIR